MTGLARIAVALCLALAAPGRAHGAACATRVTETEDAGLVVRFVDDRGEPLSRQRVHAQHEFRDENTRRSRSRGLSGAPRALDADGVFRLEPRDGWRGTVVVSIAGASRHSNERGRFEVPWDGGSCERILVVPRTASIEGRVVTPLPYHGIELSISNADISWYVRNIMSKDPSVSTWEGFPPDSLPLDLDAEGRFRFDDIGPGTFDLRVRRGHAEASTRVSVGPGETWTLPDLDLAPEGAWFVGWLEDDQGAPVAGVRVRVRNAAYRGAIPSPHPGDHVDVRTDASGRFRLGALGDSVYLLEVGSADVRTRWPGRDTLSSCLPAVRRYVRCEPDATLDLGTLTVPTAGLLVGRVALPVPRARDLEVVPSFADGERGVRARIRRDGRFVVAVAGPGPHEFTVTASLGATWKLGPFQARAEPSSEDGEVLFTPPATGLDLPLPSRALSAWSVSLHRSGERTPVRQLTLTRTHREWSGLPATAPPGRLDGLDPGTYDVVARSADGRLRSIETVEVRGGARTSARFPEDSVSPLRLTKRLARAVDAGDARVELLSSALAAPLGPRDCAPGPAQVLVQRGDRADVRRILHSVDDPPLLDLPTDRCIPIEIRATVGGRIVSRDVDLVHELGFQFEQLHGGDPKGANPLSTCFLVPEGRYSVETEGARSATSILVRKDSPTTFEIEVGAGPLDESVR